MICVLLRLTLSLSLGLAALGKLLDLPAFQHEIALLVPLSGYLTIFLGDVVVLLEFACAIFLIVNSRLRLAAISSAFLFGLFFALHLVKLAQGTSLQCGCFGVLFGVPPTWPWSWTQDFSYQHCTSSGFPLPITRQQSVAVDPCIEVRFEG
jgi:uncharacterized membrane protein YphA (DoxX/SURF4 family)